jgi:hypothetical protein
MTADALGLLASSPVDNPGENMGIALWLSLRSCG